MAIILVNDYDNIVGKYQWWWFMIIILVMIVMITYDDNADDGILWSLIYTLFGHVIYKYIT